MGVSLHLGKDLSCARSSAVEHLTFNQGVEGSNPSAHTIPYVW